MSRSSRQSKILDIIYRQTIDTQEELVAELKKVGYNVTQATVSRDIKELNLIKTLTDGGKYKYVVMSDTGSKLSAKYLNLFREAVVSVTPANNLVVVKTIAGSASAIENAIGQLNIPEVLGAVASGDTLLVVAKDTRSAIAVAEELIKYQY